MGGGVLNGRKLFAALDAQRMSYDMTWQEFADTIGVSASTLRRLRQGGPMESDGVLAMVRWLGRTVSFFTTQAGSSPEQAAPVSTATSSATMLRVDLAGLHAALDAKRTRRGLKWAAVADEISTPDGSRITAASLSRLRRGGRIAIDQLLAIVDWLDEPVETFTLLTDR